MTALSVIVAAFTSCSILAIVVYISTRKSSVDEVTARLSRYTGIQVTEDEEVHIRTGNPLRDAFTAMGEGLNPILSRTAYTGRLAEDLQNADLKIKSSEWLVGVFGVSLIVGVIAGVRYGSVIAALVGVVVIWLGSGIYLRVRQSRRRRAFERQLGDTIVLLSNALKAGYSFAQALATVSKSSGPPIGDEFGRATREIALGISVDEALNNMVQRNKSEDFDLLVTAVQIQRVVGGNLAEILDTIAFTIRERVRIQGEIRTLTAQARFSGIIIFILPIALAVILSFISPDYFGPMLKETGGKIMLAIGAVSMVIGYGLIQKIVKIEV